MPPRSTATDVVLAIATVWAAGVVVQAGQASGDWLAVIGQTLALIVLACLLGYLAATVDNLMDDLRSGTGGNGRGRPEPVRLRVKRWGATRGSGRGTPPSA